MKLQLPNCTNNEEVLHYSRNKFGVNTVWPYSRRVANDVACLPTEALVVNTSSPSRIHNQKSLPNVALLSRTSPAHTYSPSFPFSRQRPKANRWPTAHTSLP